MLLHAVANISRMLVMSPISKFHVHGPSRATRKQAAPEQALVQSANAEPQHSRRPMAAGCMDPLQCPP